MLKLARVSTDGHAEFAVGASGLGWLRYGLVGLDVRTTADAIEAFPVAVDAYSRAEAPLLNDPELLAPVHGVGKIVAVGLNYLDHIRETGGTIPERPIIFAKYTSSVTGPFAPIVIDEASTEQGDYESELAVVIGHECRRATEDDALSFVFGYAVANDVSARDWQRRDSQFSRSKSFDTFCPIGPWITPAGDVRDPHQLDIRSFVNDEVRQDSTTKEMIFRIPFLIEFLSQTMTLHPGDVILTGTPHGVGFVMTPPRFLRPGDRVACEVDGLGRIDNPVVGAR